jgi:hypothetical protein
MHALLAAAALLVDAPSWLKLLGLTAALGHGYRRRPAAPPERLVLSSDGRCLVPTLAAEPLRLGPSTRYARGWVRLVDESRRLDLLLLADQVDAEDWPRLSALVRRLCLNQAARRGEAD